MKKKKKKEEEKYKIRTNNFIRQTVWILEGFSSLSTQRPLYWVHLELKTATLLVDRASGREVLKQTEQIYPCLNSALTSPAVVFTSVVFLDPSLASAEGVSAGQVVNHRDLWACLEVRG